MAHAEVEEQEDVEGFEVDEEELEAEGEVDINKMQTDFAFRGPVALRIALEEAAHNHKMGVSQLLRKITADYVGYALQANAGRAKLSDAEKAQRAEAAKAAAKAERARVREAINAQLKARGLEETSTGK